MIDPTITQPKQLLSVLGRRLAFEQVVASLPAESDCDFVFVANLFEQ